jgi:hypothetical protein
LENPEKKKKKRINTTAKGARLERKTIEIMKADGFECMRSAASKGPFDVVCFRYDVVKCIQVKANRMPGKKEMDNLKSIILPEACQKIIFVFKDGKPNDPEIIIL